MPDRPEPHEVPGGAGLNWHWTWTGVTFGTGRQYHQVSLCLPVPCDQTLPSRQLLFTTKKDAPAADVLQGTDACVRSPGVTHNVTDTVSIPAYLNQGRDSCNVLSPGPPPAAMSAPSPWA